jgi:hypothetical protein
MTEKNKILLKWWYNKNINPISKKKIKQNGKVWNTFLKKTLINNAMNDIYHKYHKNYIDPLSKFELKKYSKNIYSYKYCWDPLNGNILGKDPRGALYFDSDFLIHYFYCNRLNHLWNQSDDNYSSSFGDGLGNGPDFYIPGRGYSYNWYLFRLPLYNAYCNFNKIGQQTTLTPELSKEDIIKIYDLACKKKNNYKKLFNRNRPNLIEMYELYNLAILKPNYDISCNIDKEMIKENFSVININALNKLKNL